MTRKWPPLIHSEHFYSPSPAGFKEVLEGTGIEVAVTPYMAPNCNAFAERFVLSIKLECLERMIFFGHRRFRQAENAGVTPGTNPPASRRTSASNHDSPRIAVSDSSVYVVWEDYRNGNGDIYFNLAVGYQPYGQGTPGSGGFVSSISGSGKPSIGGTAAIDVTNGLGGARGVLAVGLQGPAMIPVDGGALLVQRPAHVKSVKLGGAAGVPGAGSASVTFEIPNAPSLLGTRVNFQAAIFDPEALGRAALTRGLEMWIL